MTLHDFLEATATIPAPVLQRALVQALVAEPARTPAARRRLYARVTEHLDVATGGAVSDNGEADTEAMHHAA